MMAHMTADVVRVADIDRVTDAAQVADVLIRILTQIIIYTVHLADQEVVGGSVAVQAARQTVAQAVGQTVAQAVHRAVVHAQTGRLGRVHADLRDVRRVLSIEVHLEQRPVQIGEHDAVGGLTVRRWLRTVAVRFDQRIVEKEVIRIAAQLPEFRLLFRLLV